MGCEIGDESDQADSGNDQLPSIRMTNYDKSRLRSRRVGSSISGPGGEPAVKIEALPASTGRRIRLTSGSVGPRRRLILDRMQAVHVAEGQLDALNAAGRWNIWNSVPWVVKPGAGL